MKHALIVATVGSFITSFEKNDIKILQEMGYQVHAACDASEKKEQLEQLGVTVHPVSFARSPLNTRNVSAYRELKKIMWENTFSIVHCHTPVGGVLARLAAGRYRRKGMKVVYTAHGFHFFRGASWKNWIIFYPVEKLLARRTDVLVTINREDYERACRKFHAGRIVYIPGVGVDLDRFRRMGNGEELRRRYGWNETDIYLLSVGELTARKNHALVIRAVKELDNPHIHYVIAGRGPLKEELEQLAQRLQIDKQVHLVGRRDDIADLCEAADIFVFPSRQEGLPVALMEAMAMGLPCVVGRIRGNVDLLAENEGGMLCGLDEEHMFADAIRKLAEDKQLRLRCGEENRTKIRGFSLEVVDKQMRELYESL